MRYQNRYLRILDFEVSLTFDNQFISCFTFAVVGKGSFYSLPEITYERGVGSKTNMAATRTAQFPELIEQSINVVT